MAQWWRTCLQCRRHRRWRFHPGLGRPPGGGNGNPLQYSCMENPMDRGAWHATIYGVTKSRTRLSTHMGEQTYCHNVWSVSCLGCQSTFLLSQCRKTGGLTEGLQTRGLELNGQSLGLKSRDLSVLWVLELKESILLKDLLWGVTEGTPEQNLL